MEENIAKKTNEDIKKEVATPKTYTEEEVISASTEYFKGDILAAKVWLGKYALKDSYGNIYELTPDDMHRRLAKEVYRIEKMYSNPISEEEIYDLFKKFKYVVPQGGPMAGIGNNYQTISLANCFVVGSDKDDSYGSILKTDQEQVQLMKRRGGVGHDLSYIRPKGSVVKNSALTSTGIVPFMERYSNSTREVAQDGRRGALMLSISIKHPDVEDFINAKTEQGKVTGANVSVKIDDEFMEAMIKDKKYIQKFPVDSDNPKVVKEIDPKVLWNKIIHNSWATAEPGVLFWDTIIKESVSDCYADLGFKTICTNPCSELPLSSGDSCRLIAINLYSYVDNPFTKEAKFNFELFAKHTMYTQRIMDDIIDLELEKIDQILEKINNDPEEPETKRCESNLWNNIKRKCAEGRRMGIGITAEGDMLAALGLRYGSKEANSFSVEVHKALALEVYKSSVILAKERGKFVIYDFEREKDNPFINRLKELDAQFYKDMQKYGRRNIALLTIAPTGTASLMTQSTSGIEPAFSIAYKRRKKVNPNDKNVIITFVDGTGDSWEEYNMFHPKFLKWLKVNEYNIEEVKHYDEEKLNEIIQKSPYYKATANDVDWVAKVKMQGAVQRWVDHSISATVNVPGDATEELIDTIYRTAWENNCKGITVYREGSRSGVLISKEEAQKLEYQKFVEEKSAPKRPKILNASVIRFINDKERWIGFMGLLEGRPYEIFTGKMENFPLPPFVEDGQIKRTKILNSKGEKVSKYDFIFKDKNGEEVVVENLNKSFIPEYWNYAKIISGVLRHGMPLSCVVELIDGLNLKEDILNTWKAGVVRMIKKYIKDGTVAKDKACPNCGDENGLIYEEGCLKCKSCGFSKCG